MSLMESAEINKPNYGTSDEDVAAALTVPFAHTFSK